METIILHTSNNGLFLQDLEKTGCAVMSLPEKPSSDCYYIIEDNLLDEIPDAFFPVIGEKTIILSEKIDNQTRTRMTGRGLVNLLTGNDPAAVTACIHMLIETEKTESDAEILIGEDDPAVQSILSGLVKRFGYTPLFAGSSNDFFQKLGSPRIQMLLLNLGMDSLDINGFIREAAGRMEIRRVPFIAYRDMQDGIYINEMLCGLNRFTRFILSPRELFSMLAGLLYRKDLIPSVHNLTRLSSLKEHSLFAEETLPRIYHHHREEIFSLPDLSAPHMLKKISDLSCRLHQSVIKVEGLQWLLNETESIEISTCGWGG